VPSEGASVGAAHAEAKSDATARAVQRPRRFMRVTSEKAA